MELHIIDTAWGIDRKTGMRGEAIAAEETFGDLKVGPLPPIGPSKQVFVIEEIKEDSIRLFLSPKRGAVEIVKGQPYDYRPMSMDGGHYFRIELK